MSSGRWKAEEREHEIHVHPLEDLIEHTLDGTDCACGTKLTIGEDGQIWRKPLVTHSSLDGRELNEPDYEGPPGGEPLRKAGETNGS